MARTSSESGRPEEARVGTTHPPAGSPGESRPAKRSPAGATTRDAARVAARWAAPEVARRYAGERWRGTRAAERDPALVARLLERHAPGRLARVLDVPCGTGRLAATLAARAERVVAADVSPGMLAEHAGARLRADAARLPFAAARFDAVVCCRLLHHLGAGAELDRVVAELVRVSRGVVVVSFWDAASWHALRRRKGWRRGRPDARRAIPRAELAAAFARAGARVEAWAHSFRGVSQQAFALARVAAGRDAPLAEHTARRPEGRVQLLVACEAPGEAPGTAEPGGRRGGEPARADLVERLLAAARAGRRASALDELDGRPVFFKSSPLAGKAALRHALRAHLLRSSVPRLRELANLRWLRARGFDAPRPLAAGCLWRRGEPRYQALWTEVVEGACDLRAWWPHAGAAERAKLARELGTTAARLHRAGFVHCDLFPRNLLVRDAPRAEDGGRLVLLDAWRGGPDVRLRDGAYDLACLLLRPDVLEPDAWRELLGTYLAAAEIRDAAAFLGHVRAQRAQLARRLTARPKDWRGHGAPPADWDPAPVLAALGR